MNFISYWFSDTMVLKAYRAQEVGEDHYLYRIVADLAQRADLPMPKVYIIPTEVPMPSLRAAARPMQLSLRRLESWTSSMKMKSAVSWPMK